MKIHIIGGPGKRSSNRNHIGSAGRGTPDNSFLKENHPVIAAVILAALAVLPAVGLAERQHRRGLRTAYFQHQPAAWTRYRNITSVGNSRKWHDSMLKDRIS